MIMKERNKQTKKKTKKERLIYRQLSNLFLLLVCVLYFGCVRPGGEGLEQPIIRPGIWGDPEGSWSVQGQKPASATALPTEEGGVPEGTPDEAGGRWGEEEGEQICYRSLNSW